MAQKYIIIDNEIIMGNVEFHIELVGKNRTSKPVGGGRFSWDRERSVVYLYGESFDFGRVTKKQFDDAFPNSLISPFMQQCEFFFSEQPTLAGAMREYDEYRANKPAIELKTWPQYFQAIKKGLKTFEIRKNDRNFCVGDILNLREYILGTNSYTGNELKVEVTYVLKDYQAVGDGFVVMGIKFVKEANTENLNFKASKEIIARAINVVISKHACENTNSKNALNAELLESMITLFS